MVVSTYSGQKAFHIRVLYSYIFWYFDVESELYILAGLWLWSYWSLHVHSLFCSGITGGELCMWHFGDCDLADYPMSVPCPALGNQVVGCAFWHIGDCDCADDSMYISCPGLEIRLWVVHSGILVAMIMLMIPCPFFALLWQPDGELCILAYWVLSSCWWFHGHALSCSGNKMVSCAFWHIGCYDHADDSISILHFALAIIGGELCILADWWLWSYWWLHVHSSSCSGNYSMWVVHPSMLVIMLMTPCPFFVLLWQS